MRHTWPLPCFPLDGVLFGPAFACLVVSVSLPCGGPAPLRLARTPAQHSARASEGPTAVRSVQPVRRAVARGVAVVLVRLPRPEGSRGASGSSVPLLRCALCLAFRCLRGARCAPQDTARPGLQRAPLLHLFSHEVFCGDALRCVAVAAPVSISLLAAGVAPCLCARSSQVLQCRCPRAYALSLLATCRDETTAGPFSALGPKRATAARPAPRRPQVPCPATRQAARTRGLCGSTRSNRSVRPGRSRSTRSARAGGAQCV
ncbi:hypothetical protein ERJ75_001689500 [Trypanosoma vivax]|nr:hypothetical protein ERJ75_001689500 [Trypanosoma vivax]